MRCPASACGAENAEARRYCGQCGRTLKTICSRCGFLNSVSDRFCGGCGVEFVTRAGVQTTTERTVRSETARVPAAPPLPPRAPTTPVPAPAPAPALAPTAAPASGGVRAITEGELDSLLGALKPSANENTAPALPHEQIGQADIDRLFEVA